MTIDALEPDGFLTAECPECRREVLTYLDAPLAGSDEEPVRRCLHCDERLPGGGRRLATEELESAGYDLDPEEEPSAGSSCASCPNARFTGTPAGRSG